MKIPSRAAPWTACLVLPFIAVSLAAEPIPVLIVDGQNNHNWAATTPVMKQTLEGTGLFRVDVATSPPRGQDLSAFQPHFSAYRAVVLNYNGDPWPEPTREAFVAYVKQGGGVVVVHAANNAFARWDEYNRITGLGGWEGRNEQWGPYLRWRDGEVVRDNSPGGGGGHGPIHEFVVTTRAPEHPVMKGLPEEWMHARDEMYHAMRGPAEETTLLATSFSAREKGGTGEHEPMLLTIGYGEGRVFHTMLGHDVESMRGLGFQVTLQRGTEWAATGKVTQPAITAEQLPADRVALRDFDKIVPAE